MQDGLPSAAGVQKKGIGDLSVRRVTFDTKDITVWDSGLLTFLSKFLDQCKRSNVDTDLSGLPEGVRRLLALASAVPERKGARRSAERESLLSQIGSGSIHLVRCVGEMVGFLGEVVPVLLKFLVGRAHFRRSDLATVLEACGPQALPIVTLISFLVGLILAFIGAIQLKQFGAQIYVADLVGLGMAREMGAMMVGIIMAGRTGAAFAAQLGTMTVNEEIDAFSTMGISPMEFLILPRMLALILVMPLLTLYADFMGMLGGAFVGVVVLDLGLVQYVEQTRAAVNLTDLLGGVAKGGVYGVLVAVAGCLRGMQSGRSASAVGVATTSAVVTAIVFIVVASAILTVLYDVIGI
jgi:phospholipid/cholesterol/gamma-HCH transport system permease protein